jgi:hypothetical protein
MKSKLIVTIVLLSLSATKLLAQKGDFDTTKRTSIDLVRKQVSQSVVPDSTNSFPLKALPDTLTLSFSEKDYEKTRIILFNKGKKDSLILGWNGKGKNVQNFQLSDFEKGRITLSFAANSLINIGNREKPINPFLFQNWDVWVKIETNKPNKPADEKPEADACTIKPDSIQSIYKVVNNEVNTMINCILCNIFPKCPDSVDCPGKLMTLPPFFYNQNPLSKRHPATRKPPKQAAMYRGLYDVQKKPLWYKDTDVPESIITDLSKVFPIAGSEMQLVIKGTEEDEDYIVTADGKSEFMEEGKEDVLSTAINGGFTDSKLSEKEKKQEDKDVQEATAPLNEKAFSRALDSIGFDLTGFAFVSKGNDSITKADIVIKKGKLPNLQFESAINIANEIKIQLKDSLLQEYNHLRDSIIEANKNAAWKVKFMALDKVLQHFNTEYINIDFKEKEYRHDLAIIQQGIKSCLGISIPSALDPKAADLLKKGLDIIKCSEVNSKNLKDCQLLIESIVAEYKAAVSKSTQRRIFYKTIQIPDADAFKLSIISKKNNKPILERTFHVKGGWCLNLSTGIFYNTLGKGEYISSLSNFRYLETRDSFFVDGSGNVVNNVKYTGNIRDTSGYFIKHNAGRVNYGAGVFVHVYKRSGKAFNLGAGIGFQLNNSGQALLMLGLSPMIQAGSRRIAFIGGVTLGKRTYLSSSAEAYVYKQEYAEFDQGTSIYKNKAELPRFYNNATELKAATYEKIGIGFFIGVGFNLANFNL